MKFAIRDDDISYFTSPKHLVKTYKGIWEKVPISFAVVPFIHGSFKFAPKRYRKDRYYPIAKNKQLIRLIKDKLSRGMASIMLHGYSHMKNKGLSEFEGDNNLHEAVKEGKEYLEMVFDTNITSFVAPNHVYSKKGMKAVIDNKLNIVGPPSIIDHPFFFKLGHIKNITKLSIFRLLHGPGIRYPYPLDYGNHKEIYCYSIVPFKPIEISKGLEFCRKKEGIFCIAVHSHAIKGSLSRLRDLVKKSQIMGAEYITIESIL